MKMSQSISCSAFELEQLSDEELNMVAGADLNVEVIRPSGPFWEVPKNAPWPPYPSSPVDPTDLGRGQVH